MSALTIRLKEINASSAVTTYDRVNTSTSKMQYRESRLDRLFTMQSSANEEGGGGLTQLSYAASGCVPHSNIGLPIASVGAAK